MLPGPRRRRARAAPCGVFAIESARIASAIPGASRSSTRARRLGRDVARREAGTAGRQHERAASRRAPRSPPRSRPARPGRRAARPRSPPPPEAPRAGRRSRPRACPRRRRPRRSGPPAFTLRSFVFSTSAHIRDRHVLVDRLRHVVDGQRRDRGGDERLHLDAGLRRRLGRRGDLDARRRRPRA